MLPSKDDIPKDSVLAATIYFSEFLSPICKEVENSAEELNNKCNAILKKHNIIVNWGNDDLENDWFFVRGAKNPEEAEKSFLDAVSETLKMLKSYFPPNFDIWNFPVEGRPFKEYFNSYMSYAITLKKGLYQEDKTDYSSLMKI